MYPYSNTANSVINNMIITTDKAEAFISTFKFNKQGSINYLEIELICNELTDDQIDLLITMVENYRDEVQSNLENNKYKPGKYYFNVDPWYISYEESNEELEALDKLSKADEILTNLESYERPND